MKKNIFPLLFISLFYISNLSAGLLSWHGGITLSGNTEINSSYYKNSGIIASFNVNVDTSTLSNSGSIKGCWTDIKCSQTCDITGSVTGSSTCNIKTQLLEGNGNIEGGKVVIICDEFKFKGTILAEECTIYSKHTFDYSSFTRNNNGKYTVIISAKGPQYFSHESLQAHAISTMVDHCLMLPENEIMNKLTELSSIAYLNNIDSAPIFEELKRTIESTINDYSTKLEEKRGPSSELNMGITCASMGAGSIGLTAAAIVYRNFLTQRFRLNEEAPFVIATFLAAGAGLFSHISYRYISDWLNPQYKERYQKLALILPSVEQVLTTPPNPEAQIIKLQ